MIDLLLKLAKVSAFIVLVLFLSQIPIRQKRICDHFGDNMRVKFYAAKLAEKFDNATVWMSQRIRHQERGIAYSAIKKKL